MKMKKLFFITILLAFSFQIIGQKDEKAKTILKEVSDKTKSYTSLKLKFLYISESKAKKSADTTKGTIFIKGEMYKLFFGGNEIFSDGKTVWTHQVDLGEITITEPDPKDDNALNPSNILQVYEKGFKYKFMGEFTSKGITFYQIDLYPEQPKQKNYSIVKLKIDKAKSQLESIKMIGKDGNDNTIELLEFTPNAKVTDTMFKFDPAKYPKDIEINDMREK
jgi:outer membrane lipoprotein-sorting protein